MTKPDSVKDQKNCTSFLVETVDGWRCPKCGLFVPKRKKANAVWTDGTWKP
jgi:hypothetical protein